MKLKTTIKNKINERELYKYPLLVSYPRSGTHWVNYLMEMYFDRPRALSGGISPFDKTRKDYMWISTHDMDLKILRNISKLKDYKFKKILYLYRSPFNTVYSFIKFNVRNPEENNTFNYKTEEEGFSDESLIAHFNHLENHNNEYLNNHLVIPIRYENLLSEKTREEEFKKICDFFEYKFDSVKFNEIFNKLEKMNLSEWTGERIGDEERKEFRKKMKRKIL